MRIGGLCKRLDTRWMGISGSEKEGNSWLDWLILFQDLLSVCIAGLKDEKDVALIGFCVSKVTSSSSYLKTEAQLLKQQHKIVCPDV